MIHRLSSPTRFFTATLLAASLSGLCAAAQAQPKIATVDLQKVFEGYYKTKQADTQLRESGQNAEKQYNGLLVDYKKANDDYKKLVESANDQAVSSEERDKRKKAAEAKVLELNDIEKSLTQFRREKQETFNEQKVRMRDQIVREIRDVINTKARTAGYTLVLDSSGKTANAVPFILFSSGENDLTEEILHQVNIGAPPGILDSGTTDKGDIKLNIPEQEREKSTMPGKGR